MEEPWRIVPTRHHQYALRLLANNDHQQTRMLQLRKEERYGNEMSQTIDEVRQYNQRHEQKIECIIIDLSCMIGQSAQRLIPLFETAWRGTCQPIYLCENPSQVKYPNQPVLEGVSDRCTKYLSAALAYAQRLPMNSQTAKTHK